MSLRKIGITGLDVQDSNAKNIQNFMYPETQLQMSIT